MAVSEFPRALARVLVYEGGKVDDPHDPGGRTAYGITQTTYNTWRRRQGLATRDVFLITAAEVSAIYKALYWDRIKGDILPVGVGIVVFDGSVNSGVSQSAKWLQRALGTDYTGAIDGDFGPRTMQAVADDQDNDQLVARFCARRLGSLKKLRTFPRYGKGWSARIANVQKIGQAWATGSVGPQPVSVADLGGHMKALVTDTRDPVIPQPVSHTAAGTGAVGSTLTQLTDLITPYKDAHKYATIGFLALTATGIGLGAWGNYRTFQAKQARDGVSPVYVDPDADNNLPPVSLPGDTNDPPAPNPPTKEPQPPAPIETKNNPANAPSNDQQDAAGNEKASS